MPSRIKIYADRECNNRVETIEWENELIIKLVTGKKKVLSNTARANRLATAVVYLRNESRFPYAITDVSFPDKRVEYKVENAWLESFSVTKLMVEFMVPENITPADVVRAGKISIKGYHVYGVG